MKVFSTFRLDTQNHSLWRGDERLSLPPKAFDVLRYLVEHADRLVTQDEILEALWPETYVNPEVVKKYVLGIRKVLGDHSDRPTFVATFPRRGYQFIAPVRDETSSNQFDVIPSEIKRIVGREEALGQLDHALSRALQGNRQIIFVTGEAGIGKTTLLDVFQQNETFRSKVLIARGQCVEGFGGKEAYYPIFDALGKLFREEADCTDLLTFSNLAPTWLVQFPSLVKSEQREALEKEIIGATRERMVRELCEALETITAKTPLVLCLEDLHWVDPSTLDFISALARRRGPAKLLVVGTYRPADVIISQSPLKALKQDLVIHKLSHEIALERLEEADVADYLRLEFVDADFPVGLAQMIYGHSGGNALFMATIIQDMVKKEFIAKSEGRWELTVSLELAGGSVPETLDQLIEAQFQQLSPTEQRILRSASVAGERFSVWAIATAAEMETDLIEDACTGLAERLQFVKSAGYHELSNGEFSSHYEFRHSLYREVLYRRLSESTRSKLHRLLADRLETLCVPCELEMATELAAHFEGGRDFQQAIRYLILAAENASRRFAYRDSIEILEHGIDLLAKLAPALRAELEIKLFELIGEARFALGAMSESTEAYLMAASCAEQAGLKIAQLQSLTAAMCSLGFTEPDRGIAVMKQAVNASAGQSDPLLLARTQMLAATCRLVFDAWCPEDADLCTSAYETLLRIGDTETLLYQRMEYWHVFTLQGKYREALKVFETGVDSGASLIAHFIALSGKTLSLLRLGEFGEVLRLTRAGRERAEKNGNAPWLFNSREAWLRLLAFDFEGAQRLCDAIYDPRVVQLDGQPQTIGRVAAGYKELDRGDCAKAIELFAQVRDPEVPTRFFLHWMWRLTARLDLSNAWLLAGDVPKARKEADAFSESALATSDPHLRALAWELKSRVALAENDMNAASDAIQHALTIVGKFEILVAGWQVHATAWQVYRLPKDRKTAEAHRERAEEFILKIANSFSPEEPLRATFLAALPVARVLRASQTTGSAR